ncbi:MAG: hypothetical protein ACKON8_03555, partial [Planctomycetota bacterium]
MITRKRKFEPAKGRPAEIEKQAPGASIASEEIAVSVAANARSAKVVPVWSPKYPHWIPNAAGAE